jgi:hypothetical protein
MAAVKQFEHLNTSYVNLAALLKYLREQNFSGSIHVALDQYEAEIFLKGSGSAAAFEIDRDSGVPTHSEGAMERALVHAREPGGTLTVYEGKTQPGSTNGRAAEPAKPALADQIPIASALPTEQVDWDGLFRVSGDLIAAVERAVKSVGADFGTNFRTACIAAGDDYPFMDPTASNFNYANGTVGLDERPGAGVYVTGLSECLRRTVNKLAIDKEGKRFRERVAVELAVTARMRPNGLGDFKVQLDRIAGTRVL